MTNYSAKHWAIKAEKSAKDAESYASGIDLSSYATKTDLQNVRNDFEGEDVNIKNEINTLKNSVESNISEINQQIANKTNKDLSDMTQTGKETVASLCMPSDEYIDLTLGVNLSKYTAPANGYLTLSKVTGNGNQFVCLRNVNNGMRIYSGMVSNNAVRVFMPVKKGHVVEIEYNASGAIEYFRFIYAEGEI